MELKEIAISDLKVNIFDVLDKGWMLLSAGDYRKHNCMTVSWGFMGTFWRKPVVIAGVRPQRYTFDFIDDSEEFSLCAFPEEQREALKFCGAKSGRDCDKVTETGLTPIRLDTVEVPGYVEADLIVECRIVYSDSLSGKNFLDKSIIGDVYEQRDFHKLFYGEVLKISATDKYL